MKLLKSFVLVILLSINNAYSQPEESTVFIFDDITPLEIFSYSEELEQTSNRYFGMGSINTSYLDAVSTFSYNDNVWNTPGTWKSNSGGSFGSSNTFFSGTDSPQSNGLVMVDLSNNGKKDVVIVTSSNLRTHLNASNTIGSANQTINDGAGTYVSSGNFNKFDRFEDIAVVNNGYVRIFRNFGNGNLSTSPFGPFDLNATKVKVAKMTSKVNPYFEDEFDRADLIVISGSYIKIYRNDLDNGIISTPFESIDVGFTIFDLAIADIDGDGYNDVIISGEDQTRLYLNREGTGLNDFSWEGNEEYSYVLEDSFVIAVDVDRDGRKDLMFTRSTGAPLSILYLNSENGMTTDDYQIFLDTPIEEFTNYNVFQIDAVDIYNTGGHAFLFSFSAQTFEFPYEYPSVLAYLEPLILDPPPVPPHVNRDYEEDGILFRPKLIINKKDERDVVEYEIWKKRTTVVEPPFIFELFATIPTNTTNDVTIFIDTTEYIIFDEPNGPRYEPNCFYYVIAIDNDEQESLQSNEIEYMVGDEVSEEEESDNMASNQIRFKKPTPKDFRVENFPNPFNPITKIVFSIPSNEFVSLKVYNVLGQEIKTLINEPRNKGYHSIDFNSSSLASGMYFYVIQAGEYKQVKRMMLLK